MAGGADGSVILASAELYDPASGTWSATGSLNTARYYHTATLLPNGKVLVAGGADNSGSSRERGTVRPGQRDAGVPPAASTPHATSHTATLLPNGKVLVAGGLITATLSRSAELYDPASGSWSATGSLTTARDDHTATLLPNGKVLVAGGLIAAALSTSAELYDPASGTWSATGSLNTARLLTRRRCCPTARCWWQGDVMAAVTLSSAELYDPASGTWSATGSLNTARDFHTATLLPNGKVLVAGGFDSSGSSSRARNCTTRPAGPGVPPAASPPHALSHTATLLPNGKVLVAGGLIAAALSPARNCTMLGSDLCRPDLAAANRYRDFTPGTWQQPHAYRLAFPRHLASFRRELPGLID